VATISEGMEPAELAPDVSALIRPTPVEHPDEFVVQLTGITAPWVKAWGNIRPWYRGISKIGYSLEPSLFRYQVVTFSPRRPFGKPPTHGSRTRQSSANSSSRLWARSKVSVVSQPVAGLRRAMA
jgi:hypothetical protein